MQEALKDTPIIREFSRLVASVDNPPDESTILVFRHVPEQHDLSLQMLAAGNATLQEINPQHLSRIFC